MIGLNHSRLGTRIRQLLDKSREALRNSRQMVRGSHACCAVAREPESSVVTIAPEEPAR